MIMYMYCIAAVVVKQKYSTCKCEEDRISGSNCDESQYDFSVIRGLPTPPIFKRVIIIDKLCYVLGIRVHVILRYMYMYVLVHVLQVVCGSTLNSKNMSIQALATYYTH